MRDEGGDEEEEEEVSVREQRHLVMNHKVYCCRAPVKKAVFSWM